MALVPLHDGPACRIGELSGPVRPAGHMDLQVLQVLQVLQDRLTERAVSMPGQRSQDSVLPCSSEAALR